MVHLDYRDAKPIYTQIMDNFGAQIAAGILQPGEYAHLMDAARAADNSTMTRLIAKYAGDAAEAEDSSPAILDSAKHNETVAQLRAVASIGKNTDGSEYLKTFDSLARAFERCSENTEMIDHWDSLTGNTVENF